MLLGRVTRILIGGGSMAAGLIATLIFASLDLKKMKDRNRRKYYD